MRDAIKKAEAASPVVHEDGEEAEDEKPNQKWLL
jgi:hypothetical protein